MIRLSLGGNPPALPEWLLQCNSIDDKTQHCAGLVSDDVPILDNERVEPRFTASLSGSTARIAVDAGMSCKVMNVSAAEAADLRSGKPPQLISGGPGPFSVLSLHGMKTPILIAAIRCGDDLRFRKAAWIFTK